MNKVVDPWAEKLLVKAAEDEAVLRASGIPDAPFGFHVQQAAEKLLKALLCQLGVSFDRTHDIAMLAAQLRTVGELLPATPLALADLNSFAVEYRYDSIPELENPDRPACLETIRILREHIHARIATLVRTP